MSRRVVFSIILLSFGCTKPPHTAIFVLVEPIMPTADGSKVHGQIFRSSSTKRLPGLVLVHDDHGMTDWFKQQSRRLAELGYVVLAIDLYRGEVVKDDLDAHIMERGLPEDRVLSDIRAAIDSLTSRPDVQAGALGIVGWDIGGGWALEVARRDPRVQATVICYGRVTTDPALLAPMHSAVLGIFADKDEGNTPETLTQFSAALRQAGKSGQIVTMPDCEPGFMQTRSTATESAWEEIEKFLKKVFSSQ